MRLEAVLRGALPEAQRSGKPVLYSTGNAKSIVTSGVLFLVLYQSGNARVEIDELPFKSSQVLQDQALVRERQDFLPVQVVP
jgi:hypothetical protein